MVRALEAAGGRVLFWMKPEHERSKQKSSAFTEDKEKSTGRPCFNGVAIVQYLERFKAEGNTQAYEFMFALHEVDLRERILSTYINPIIRGLDKNNRLHCSLNQHRTVTGRFSCSAPNLQNQPKKGGSIDQKNFEKTLGVKDEEAINRQIRSLFIAPPGYVLLSQDFSSIEYRAAAYLSRDEELLEKYRKNPRLDYHAEMAQLAGVDRDLAKTCAFMILYGGGAAGLAATLTGMGRPYTKAQAQELIEKIFTARPALKQLIQDQVNISKRHGQIQTCYGRVCPQIRGFEYVALNHLDQGMCADLLRYAMVRISDLIAFKKLPVKMLLSVHDEILYELREADVEWVAPILSNEMCRCSFMDIPVVVDSEVGPNWKDQIPLEEWLAVYRAANPSYKTGYTLKVA
jgi:DNA polymerase-1